MIKSRIVLLAIGAWLWGGCEQNPEEGSTGDAKPPAVYLWEKDSTEARKLLDEMSRSYIEMPDSLRPKDSLLRRRIQWTFRQADSLARDSSIKSGNEASPDSVK